MVVTRPIRVRKRLTAYSMFNVCIEDMNYENVQSKINTRSYYHSRTLEIGLGAYTGCHGAWINV